MKTELEKIYIKIPALKCKKKCHSSCSGIFMSNHELNIIINRLGYNPFKYNNAEDLYKNVKIEGLGCLKCPLLGDNNECTQYDIRPLICRLWGTLKVLRCPYGCKPVRWLKDKKARKLLDLVGELK